LSHLVNQSSIYQYPKVDPKILAIQIVDFQEFFNQIFYVKRQ